MLKKHFLFIPVLLSIFLIGCKPVQSQENKSVNVIDVVQQQYDILYDSIQSRIGQKFYIPRAIKNGHIKYARSYDWTSGFYAGSLWYLYDLSQNDKWRVRALDYTERLDSVKYYTGNHDIGFMMESSFGNAMRLYPSKKYDDVIVQSAKSLLTRFRPKAGIIQSWDKGKEWDCPVIIDNMMNLELLFHASEISGDNQYRNVAITHANTTLKNHFRADNSSYHVVDYDIETGTVIVKETHQGLAHESAWARGQSWGLYGYTVMYRETKDPKYLDQANKIAAFIMNHPNLPTDKIPYWDYDVKGKKDTKRDASAGAIVASALIELQDYVDAALSKKYLEFAETVIKSLKSNEYLAKVGTNKGFILEHSVGTLPYKVEVDVPLNYADYYFLEAMYRLKQFKK